jgi:hypothetical protein
MIEDGDVLQKKRERVSEEKLVGSFEELIISLGKIQKCLG